MQLEHDILSLKASVDFAFRSFQIAVVQANECWGTFQQESALGYHRISKETYHAVTKAAMTVEAAKIAFVLSCAALVEAIANLALSMKMAKPQFDAIDSCSVQDKWVEILPLVIVDFKIDRDGQVFQSIRELSYDRNAITHMKPKIVSSESGELLHKGQFAKHSKGGYEDVEKKLTEWRDLPPRLIALVSAADLTLGQQLDVFCGYWQPYA